jgi:hypothetical protein
VPKIGKPEYRTEETGEQQRQEYPPLPRLGRTSWKNGIFEE